MFSYEGFSSKLIAAAGSFALTVLVFATAIMPANQGALLPAATMLA
jgi:hypothetical protein